MLGFLPVGYSGAALTYCTHVRIELWDLTQRCTDTGVHMVCGCACIDRGQVCMLPLYVLLTVCSAILFVVVFWGIGPSYL